jgi:hypothetical protein
MVVQWPATGQWRTSFGAVENQAHEGAIATAI